MKEQISSFIPTLYNYRHMTLFTTQPSCYRTTHGITLHAPIHKLSVLQVPKMWNLSEISHRFLMQCTLILIYQNLKQKLNLWHPCGCYHDSSILATLIINIYHINGIFWGKSFESLCLKPRQAAELNCCAIIDLTSEISFEFQPIYQFQPYWNSEYINSVISHLNTP